MSVQRISLAAATAVLLLVVAVSCQNSAAPTTQAAAVPAQHAIYVDGGNGRTAVFLPPATPGGPPVVYCSSGTVEVCPECNAAAIKYFETGVLDPKCSRTGATRTVIDYVPPPTNVGHQ